MPNSPGEPVELYRARNSAEAHALRDRLEEEGVPALVGNELLQGVVGEVPGGWVTAPTVLVNAENLDRAEAVLADFLRQEGGSGAEVSPGDPLCLACRQPMGEAVACPSCGWTFQSPERAADPDPAAESPMVEAAPTTVAEPQARPEPQPPGPHAGWGEVTAVLCIGVLPLIPAVVTRTEHSPVVPYWADSVDLTVVSACAIFATLYIIRRSGEPWEHFGIVRPKVWDIPLGLLLFFLADLAWRMQVGLGLYSNAPGGEASLPLPRDSADRWMMVGKYLVSGFAEELVCRAYLITRLQTLLRSRGWALLLSSAAFASYHAYQGWTGVLSNFLTGLVFGVGFLALRRLWPVAIGHTLTNYLIELGYGN